MPHIPARALDTEDILIAQDGTRTAVIKIQPTPDHGMFILEAPWLDEPKTENATARYFPPGENVHVELRDWDDGTDLD